MSDTGGTPAEKLAALNERLKGTSLLALLNIKSKPAPDALVQRVGDLREVVFGLCSHLPPDDPVRATALERLRGVEALLQDPLEWHILTRADEVKQDASDPQVRAIIEAAFYEEHVPRTVWQTAPPEGAQAELRRSMRLPVLIDVELDIAGKRTRCQTQNLSRDGVCLEVPAGFSATHVTMVLLPASTGAQISVEGDVVWREAGRVGIAFKIGVPEQNALDAALHAHFTSLTKTVDRWREVAPKSSAAVACAALVGYASSALPSSRKEHVDKLAAAAQADFGSKELQLALAKLRIEERDYDGAGVVLKRIVVADRADPRYSLLERTLAQRQGRAVGGIGASIRRAVAAAKVPLLVIAMFLGLGAVLFAVIGLRGPYSDVAVPNRGLPCDRIQLLQSNALCYIDPGKYSALKQAERAKLALATVDALGKPDVNMVSVYTLNEDRVLDIFDSLALDMARRSR